MSNQYYQITECQGIPRWDIRYDNSHEEVEYSAYLKEVLEDLSEIFPDDELLNVFKAMGNDSHFDESLVEEQIERLRIERANKLGYGGEF